MAFEYTPYRNPYIGTIADLMARGEDAKAKALIDVASAQARATEAKGQIYGNAIQNIGQSASKALSDYTLEKQNAPIRAQEAEMRAMTLAAARDNQQIGRGKEFLASTMNPPDPNYQKDPVTGQSPLPGPPSPDNRDIYKPGPYGSKFMDPNLAQQRLVDAGFGAHLEALMPIVEKQNARNSAFVAGKNKARGEYARDALTTMQAGVPWAQALELAGHSGVENGVFDANELADLTRQGEGQPPAAQQAILFNIMRQGGAETTLEAPGQIELLGGIPTGRNTGEKPPTKSNPVSMMENGLPVTVQEVERSDGTSAWVHLDGTPVTGTLAGMPGKQEDVMRGGKRITILEGTRQTGDLPVPVPRAPGAPRPTIVLKSPAGKVQMYSEDSPQVNQLLSEGWELVSKTGTGVDKGAALKFQDDYARDSKPWIVMRDAYQRVTAASATAAGDLSMVFAYMKMLDPNSVVRETEFANAQNAAGVPDRIRAQWNRMLKGTLLSKPQRDDFLSQASGLVNAARANQKQVRATYESRAKQWGIPPSMVLDEPDAILEPLEARAEAVLKAAGRDTSPASIKAFLLANPGFR